MFVTCAGNLEIVLYDVRLSMFDNCDKRKKGPYRSNVGGPQGMDESFNNMLGGNVSCEINNGLFKLQAGI